MCDREDKKNLSKENREKQSEHYRKWRADNPEKVNDAVRKWTDANPERVKHAKLKNMEKKKSIKSADEAIAMIASLSKLSNLK